MPVQTEPVRFTALVRSCVTVDEDTVDLVLRTDQCGALSVIQRLWGEHCLVLMLPEPDQE